MAKRSCWKDWHEWFQVRSFLLSDVVDEQIKGIDRVRVWQTTGQVPLAVSATADLLETRLDQETRSDVQTALTLAMILVRIINGLADASRSGIYAKPISILITEIGIPLWIVDVRHEISHNKMPTLAVLRLAVMEIWNWLVVNYWGSQTNALLKESESASRWIACSPVAEASDFSYKHIREYIVPCLVYGTAFGYQTGIVVDETQESRVKEVCRALQAQWNLFRSCLFVHLCQALIVQPKFRSSYLKWIRYLLRQAESTGFPIYQLWRSFQRVGDAEMVSLLQECLEDEETESEYWRPCPLGTYGVEEFICPSNFELCSSPCFLDLNKDQTDTTVLFNQLDAQYEQAIFGTPPPSEPEKSPSPPLSSPSSSDSASDDENHILEDLKIELW